MKKSKKIVSISLTGKARFIYERFEKLFNKRGKTLWRSKFFQKLIIDKFDNVNLTEVFAREQIVDLNNKQLDLMKEANSWVKLLEEYEKIKEC